MTFSGDSKGGVAIMFGFIIPVLIGMAGLGVDGTYWMMARNNLQTATDGAAISAGQALNLNGDARAMKAEAGRLLTKIYGSEMSKVRYTVTSPPTTGAYAGKSTAVEVATEMDQRVRFLTLFGINRMFVATRAVANVDAINDSCLLALSSDADRAVSVGGSATVDLSCGIAANSNSTDAVYLSGSSSTTASGVSAVGDVFQSSNAQLTTNGGPVRSHSQNITDPYGPEGRDVKLPAASSKCDEKNLKINSDTKLSPGRYCGGLSFTGGNVTFAPGVYIIDSGDFKANGNVSLSGTDVTFILTGKGAQVASLNINGGAAVDLHAPKSGTNYDGILFYQASEESSHSAAQTSTGGKGNVINGGADLNISGALYFPESSLELSGGSGSTISCLQAVAQTVSFSGNTKISGKCKETDGTEEIKRVSIEVVE